MVAQMQARYGICNHECFTAIFGIFRQRIGVYEKNYSEIQSRFANFIEDPYMVIRSFVRVGWIARLHVTQTLLVIFEPKTTRVTTRTQLGGLPCGTTHLEHP